MAAARWGAALLALIAAGCTWLPDPTPPVGEPATSAPERAAGTDAGTGDDGEKDGSAAAVQEAALQSGQPAAPADAAPDLQLVTEESERGLVVRLDDLAFPPGSAELGRKSVPLLARLAAFLDEHPQRNALIEGHTDNTGTPVENLHLSLKRAEAVQEALIEHGVDPRRLILRGYGARHPIAGNDTEAGRQKNRRVEVVLPEEGRTAARSPREPEARR